jgi:trehalose/maltose hydrolase-like predicted phosphorylase
MLLFLLSRTELRELLAGLGYEVTEEQLARTVDYYLARTSHGSTLSGVVTAWVLARYEPEEAWRFLQQALESDVADVQGGTTAEGIHLGAMAGTVDIVLRCLAGLRPRGAVLRFDPALPPQVKQVRFSVHYRAHRARRPAGGRADQVALDRLIEEGGDGPGGDRVGDQGADEAGSGGPHDGLRLVAADGDPDDVRYASELVR